MNELIKFLTDKVPGWVASITAPLTLIAQAVTGKQITQTRFVPSPQNVKAGGNYKLPANPRRKQVIFQADVAVTLQNATGTKGMTLTANTPWTVETTDAITVNNATAGAATVEIIEILYA